MWVPHSHTDTRRSPPTPRKHVKVNRVWQRDWCPSSPTSFALHETGHKYVIEQLVNTLGQISGPNDPNYLDWYKVSFSLVLTSLSNKIPPWSQINSNNTLDKDRALVPSWALSDRGLHERDISNHFHNWTSSHIWGLLTSVWAAHLITFDLGWLWNQLEWIFRFLTSLPKSSLSCSAPKGPVTNCPCGRSQSIFMWMDSGPEVRDFIVSVL